MSKYELPKGWIEAEFAELFSLPGTDTVDGPFGSNLKASEYVHSGVPIARLQNIDRNQFVLKNIQYVTQQKAEELIRHTFSPGDILITKLGDPLGKACLAPESIPLGILVADVVRARITHPWVSNKFLCYQINSENIIEQFKDQTKGTTRPRVNLTKIRTLKVLLCPKAEQIRIIERLEELLSDLDAGIAELEAAQKKLGQYRQSLLKAAVEGELTAAWRADRAKRGEPLETGTQLLDRILAERRRRWEEKEPTRFREQGKIPTKEWKDKYPERVRPDITNLPELPEGWVWATLGLCFYVGVGATPSRKNPDYWNGDIPWVSSGEIQFSRIGSTREHISKLGLSNSSTQVNPKGSVLLGMIGEGKTRGQVSILDIDAANNQNCAAIWVSETQIKPEYVYFWLWSRYDETRRRSSGNNQPALNKSLVENIPIPLPPLNEIDIIVELLVSALCNISDQEHSVQQSLNQAETQRKSIMNSAFSGQLVPQDPDDEPASVLLERIRIERVEREKQPKKRRFKHKKEITAMSRKLIDVLAEADDWLPAQEAFRRCGVVDGAQTEQVESVYNELRQLDKANQLAVESVTDAQGRKQYDRLKLISKD